jgi:hypothetical protein
MHPLIKEVVPLLVLVFCDEVVWIQAENYTIHVLQ